MATDSEGFLWWVGVSKSIGMLIRKSNTVKDTVPRAETSLLSFLSEDFIIAPLF